jgi:membrane protein involved in colicin uptake
MIVMHVLLYIVLLWSILDERFHSNGHLISSHGFGCECDVV